MQGCRRKQSWTFLRQYPRICLEGLGKTTEILNQENRCAVVPKLKPHNDIYRAINIGYCRIFYYDCTTWNEGTGVARSVQ